MTGKRNSVVGLEIGIRRQHDRLRAALSSGMPRLGWKICVNERRTQERLGLTEPFVGFLDGSRSLTSGSTCRIGSGTFAVEPEIAVRMSRAVGGSASLGAARHAIESLAPALEIVDYHLAAPTLESIVESSSFHSGVVLGAPSLGAEAPPIGAACPALLHNGRSVGVPDPALVPADLAEVVLFVARFLEAHGEKIEAGDLILSGACTKAVRVQPEDEVRAEFDSLGTVRVRFIAPRQPG